MKLNLNTHDIYALVTELKSLIGGRVINIYDINSKTICIKININNCKKYLLIESGTKFYILDSFEAINLFPSSFSIKLRKHINNKKINNFIQVNCDRVIDITFGENPSYHLICEFYASGNIILTDNIYKILTLIHPYKYNNETIVKSGNIYPIEKATKNIILTIDNLKNLINNTTSLKSQLIKFSPCVIENVLFGINNIDNDDDINSIIIEINKMYELKTFKGYIINNNFMPIIYKQYEKYNNILEFESFSEAVTYYYNKIDKIETKKQINDKKIKNFE